MNINFTQLSKSYKGKPVFENISGQISNGDKVGMVGINGVGKTTLAKLLAGLEAKDSGTISYSPSYMKVLYIEQHPVFDENITVYDEAFRTVSYSHGSGPDIETIVKKNLVKVGLEDDKWGQKAMSLSGGEKTKLALFKACVSEFDFLILDEPTNHLDTGSLEWLEEFVLKVDKPILVISHDRFFLDKVANKIWELTSRELKAYEGNYSSYKVQRENEIKGLTKEYSKQQMKISQLKQEINQRKHWYNSAHKAAGTNDFYRSKAKKHAKVLKAKQRQLERIEKEKIDKPEKPVSPAFDIINKNITDKKLPRFLVQGKNLYKRFGNRQIFQDVSFNIRRQDKIALIGKNGVGKTTLLKIICGLDEDFSGKLEISPSVKIGYFAQELDNLNSEATILDDVLIEGSTVEETRLLLAGLLFRGDDVFKKIGNLSLGERGRVAFAKLILSGANLLVLDESTNYMDIISKEKIEEVLEEFGGSIIFVSHDRYFVRRLANKIFTIEDRKLHCFEGGYEYYLTKRKHQEKNEEIGADYRTISENIKRLELELAYLSGKLDETMDEEEKEKLNEKFLAVARELNKNRELLNRK
ncbi:MAG: ABC-F type ribosomal protection protein [Thermoanaerobacteraceae bacterium]|nr:ABC-F type ribosomal protection protein [Thermoanaerobacteraceae bacterium]